MPSLFGFLKPHGPTGFGYSSTAADVVTGIDLTGMTYLITGCNAGLGFETMKALASAGASVIGCCRTLEKATESADNAGVPPERFTAVACELAEPKSVRAAVATVASTGVVIDSIIANAGIMAPPKLQTAEGIELQYMGNHIGHFIIVTGLLANLNPNGGRVVILSSMAHTGSYKCGIRFDDLTVNALKYDPWGSYGQSKLANLLFARELAKRLPAGQTANAVHPGVANTELGRSMGLGSVAKFFVSAVVGPIAMKSPQECAATQTFMAAHPKAEGVTGEYWASCNTDTSSAHGADAGMAKRCWEETEKLIAERGW